MGLNLGKWASRFGVDPFKARENVSVVQFSGGRTSGMMTALSDPECLILFQNTGREHEKNVRVCRGSV